MILSHLDYLSDGKDSTATAILAIEQHGNVLAAHCGAYSGGIILNILFSPASLSACDFRRQRVEVNEQELTQFVHLVGHLGGSFLFAVYSLVSIKPQFMSPSLQLGRNPMLGRHSVNPLFDFPGIYVRRKSFKCQLHRFSIHAAGRVEMGGGSRSCGLNECPRYVLWCTRRGLVQICSWKDVNSVELDVRHHKITDVLRRTLSMIGRLKWRSEHYSYRHIATAARRRNNGVIREAIAHILGLNFKGHAGSATVRTSKGESHGYSNYSGSGILA